jgi:SAM-dependent methyltransferase
MVGFRQRIRGAVKNMTPDSLLDLRRRWLVSRTRRKFARLSTAETFSQIYRNRLWGEERHLPFDSGPGSVSRVSEQYCQFIRSFIREKDIKKIVDLGCGSFQVGRLLMDESDVEYVGVDIVPELIQYNQAQFGSSKVRFECLDIVEDDPPEGELCLVRQVLQHLSNREIGKAIEKCERYRYLIVTEHVYCGPDLIPNLDKPHGPDVRVYDHSGVFLDQPPFGLRTRTVLDLSYAKMETIRTVLVESEPDSAK